MEIDLKTYFANIIYSMPSIIIGISKDRKIFQFNRAAEMLSNIKNINAMGKEIGDIFPNNDAVIQRILHAVEGLELYEETKVEFVILGELRIVNIAVFPIDFELSMGVIVRIDDVTDQANLDKLIMQTEKMITVGGLAAGMAHEINNPLASTIQSIQNIERRLDPNRSRNQDIAAKVGISCEQINEYFKLQKIDVFLEGIKNGSNRAASVLETMLSFIVKSDRVKTNLNLKDLLYGVVELVSNDYSLNCCYNLEKIDFEIDLDPEAEYIYGIKNELEQVFLNIIKNSVQAMYTANSIKLKITIKARIIGGYLQICFCDSGPGIDPDISEKIFEPFFTTKTTWQGTGLGLAVAYYIVKENHDGRMRVDTEYKNGTKFVLEFLAK